MCPHMCSKACIYAIKSSTYRSHSPIVSDTCYFVTAEARKFIIGEGLKHTHDSELPLGNSGCASASCLEFRPAVLNVFGSVNPKYKMTYTLVRKIKAYNSFIVGLVIMLDKVVLTISQQKKLLLIRFKYIFFTLNKSFDPLIDHPTPQIENCWP